MDVRLTRARVVLVLLSLLAAAGCGRPAKTATPGAATTPEEARALAEALRVRLERPAARWQQVGGGGRHQVLRTGDRLGQVTVVGRAADGSLRMGCASSVAEVEAVLAGGPARGGRK